MKLKSFDTKTLSNRGVEVELKDVKTGKGSGTFFTILGTDSDKFREIKAQRSRDIMDMVKNRGEGYMPSVDEIDLSSCEMLADCTTGWRGLEDESDQPIEFTRDAAVKLYVDYPRIREQINVAMSEYGNFLAG
jgi:uncharacterized protein CbrC (UPF0167 family)